MLAMHFADFLVLAQSREDLIDRILVLESFADETMLDLASITWDLGDTTTTNIVMQALSGG